MKANVALALAIFLGAVGYQVVCSAQEIQAPPPEEGSQAASPPPPLECSEADSYQYFYQPLTPYGTWVTAGPYGCCWRPTGVAVGWRPYWEGHWVLTACGWTWVSTEPWGWACYHYGRWVCTSECGWIWVPGREWAPAWVCWRHGPEFVAWAPLAPGIAIGADIGGFAFGFDVALWTCVPCRDFLAPRCSVVALSVDRCREVMPRMTTVVNVRTVNNIIINSGPSRQMIQAATGRPVQQLALRSAAATGGAQTRISGGAVVAATPTAAMRSKPVDSARLQRVQNVTVAKTATEAQRAAQAQTKPITAVATTTSTAPASRQRGGTTATTQTPAKTRTADTTPRPTTSGEGTVNASPAQPGTVKAQPAQPEKKVWQTPQQAMTPQATPQATTPSTPGTVKAQPAQPEKAAPTTRVPQSSTGTQPRETYPQEKARPETQSHAPAASPSRVAPSSAPPAAPSRERIETPRSVEQIHAPSSAPPATEKRVVHPTSPPPQSSGGEEKGKSKENPKE